MRRRAIRFRITLWFIVVMIAIIALTVLAVRWAGSSILRKTVRDYLISAVEENTDKIAYVPDADVTEELRKEAETTDLQLIRTTGG